MLSYFSVYLYDDVYVDIIHNSPVTPIIVEIWAFGDIDYYLRMYSVRFNG